MRRIPRHCYWPYNTEFYATAAYTPLVFFNSIKNKNQRLLQWSLTLQGCIRHIHSRQFDCQCSLLTTLTDPVASKLYS